MEITIPYTLRLMADPSTKITTYNSVIFRAQDIDLGRDVCIKGIRLIGDTKKEIENSYRKSLREVKVMVKLAKISSNIPRIYSVHYDEASSQLLIIMEWIEGKTLADYMAHTNEKRFLKWIRELCKILDNMAKHNLQHKDIKPENIMINEKGELVLIDFNISSSIPNQTEGTMYYKAPEMDAHSDTTDRTKVDMFSIGVMLYQYYTKSLPIPIKDYVKRFNEGPNQWDKFVEPIEKNKDMNPVVNKIIVKCMKRNPKDRYPNYMELIKDIQQVEKGKKKRK